jgi:hypothetical protein
LAVFGGGAGHEQVQMGLIGSSQDVVDEEVTQWPKTWPDLRRSLEALAYPEHAQAHLLFITAQFEVNRLAHREVTDLMPRIVDVLNGYLRRGRKPLS